jgi:hypothetical protein
MGPATHSSDTSSVTYMQNKHGVSERFGEWYQKTNKTEDTHKLTLLAFKIIAILHNTLLAMFIKLLETVSKDLFRNRLQNRCHTNLAPAGARSGEYCGWTSFCFLV